MNTFKTSNVPLKTLEWFLKDIGVNHIRTKGGHATYSRSDLKRPITFQTHIDPVPEFIIKQVLKHVGFTKKSFCEYLENNY